MLEPIKEFGEAQGPTSGIVDGIKSIFVSAFWDLQGYKELAEAMSTLTDTYNPQACFVATVCGRLTCVIKVLLCQNIQELGCHVWLAAMQAVLVQGDEPSRCFGA